MWFTLIGSLLLAASPEFRATTLSGDAMVGRLQAVQGEQVLLETAKGVETVDSRQLQAIERTEDAVSELPANVIVVRLVDGSQFYARQFTAARGTARMELANSGTTGGGKVELATRLIRWVRLRSTMGLDESWNELLQREAQGDVVIFRKNAKGADERPVAVLDRVEGIVKDVTAEQVKFELDGDAVDMRRENLEGLIYFQPQTREFPSAFCRLVDGFGGSWNVKSMTIKGDAMTINSVDGVAAELPLTSIRRLDFSVANTQFLDELTPDSLEWQPYIESRIASANLNRFNGPEGQAFDGGKRLVLGGRSYERGLSFRSRTSVVYRLPKDGRRFLASVGIDDRAGDTGNVRLVISGDNRTLFDETVDGGQTPVELSLDVAGIRRLTILVDYGEGLDIGDFLNLCNARITK